MDDQDLRKAVIRVAHENPGEVREALLPLLKEAAAGSLTAAITKILGDVAAETGKALKQKFSESLGTFGKPFDAGRFVRNVSTEIKSTEGKPGTLAVEGRWDPRDAMQPVVRVWAEFPGAKGFARDLVFSLDHSPKAVASKLGAAFARDLERWMISIATSR